MRSAVSQMVVLAATCVVGLAACSEYEVKPPDPEPEVTPTDTDDPATPIPTPTPPPNGTPDIEVDRFENNFGTIPPACSSETIFYIGNVGDADLEISSIELQGNSDGFVVLSGGGPFTVAPNEQIELEVGFDPDDTSTYFDAVAIQSNDPDEANVSVTVIGEGDVNGGVSESFSQQGNASVPVDILFVIDNSTSMQDTNIALQNNFNTFIQGFLTLNLDYQIGVVTTDMQTATDMGQLQGPIITTATPNPVQQFNQNTNVPFTDVLEEQGLDAAHTALSAPLINTTNAGLVRADSLLSVIVISDEDDQSTGIDDAGMINFLDTYQGDPDLTSLSIVGGPRAGIFPCGNLFQNAAPVPTYWSVAQATGGIHLNLCNLDMNTIVQQLAVVAAGLDDEFFLNNTPSDPADIEVLVDGTPVTEDATNGWTYDAGNNSIVFAGTGIPLAGSNIEVSWPLTSTCP